VLSQLAKPTDSIVVAHIYNDAKDYLPTQLQQANLKVKYEATLKAINLPYSLDWAPHNPKSNLKNELLDLCIKHHAYLLSIGYYGCKGIKTSNGFSTAVDIITVNSTIPILVVCDVNRPKKRSPEK
jgi:hypothetical protein